MVRQRAVIDKFVELANNNIDDPVKPRANKDETWIFDNFPKYDNKTLPRIGFHKVTTTHGFQGIGTSTFSSIADIQASIMVRKNKAYDFDNDGNAEPGEDLADYLHDQVKAITENHQSDFRALDEVAYVIPLSSETIRPENKNFILEAVTFEVRLEEGLH